MLQTRAGPTNLRGSCVDFRRMKRWAIVMQLFLSALLTFQAHKIFRYTNNACTLEEMN